MAPEDACSADMLVLIRWQGRTMAVSLSQLAALNVDQSTANAIADWHYWLAQGIPFLIYVRLPQAYERGIAGDQESNGDWSADMPPPGMTQWRWG